MRSLVAAAVLILAFAPNGLAQPASDPDSIAQLVLELERAAAAGEHGALLQLGDGASVLEDFVQALVPAPERVVLKERDRVLAQRSARLLLELFTERGNTGRISTWQMDIRAVEQAANDAPAASLPWRIEAMTRLSFVTGLYRLRLDTTRQFDVHDLTLRAPDLTLHMPSGSAFVADTPEGTTAVVLLGRGRVRLAPADAAEQTQLRIFSGSEVFDDGFDGAFIRIRPSEFDAAFTAGTLVPRVVSPGDLRRASSIFEEYVGRTLHIDMYDLSSERWSLVPSAGDLIAEIRTRRHGSLTYARTWNDSEDVSFFDRRKKRNIAVYASAEKLAARGRFYSEDDLSDYDILSYDIDATFRPERQWVTGNARLTIQVRAPQLSTMSLRLAETLVVRGVYAGGIGRLLHLRVANQNTLIVNFPVALPRDSEVTLTVLYAGRVEPQALEREAVAVSQEQDVIHIPLEPRYIYSNRSYWYPQGTYTDYATARVRITVPDGYDVVATGMPSGEPAPAAGPVADGERANTVFLFTSERPVRYIGCVISRFATVTSAELALHGTDTQDRAAGDGNGPDSAEEHDALSLIVQANPRQAGRARSLSEKSADVIRFYASLVGEAPYPSMTLAITESELPGGHSPPYFVILNQPLPMATVSWRNDPVAFETFPSFFLAHELAHQWWGQAVGWKNYHEQWISEGFAQYFAVLFAAEERGPGVLDGLFRQMRRTAIHASDQGPIYLGYRLGHIKQDSRVFRSLVYNKAAMVLHMLRRYVGDEAFFRGLREFYTSWRFRKAGTHDFRLVMEEASRRDLEAFFEGWIHGTAIPRLRFGYKQAGDAVVLRFEHRGDVVPVPVTVKISYTNGETAEVVVPVSERVVERKVPLAGQLRKVEAIEDDTLAAILR